MRDEAGRKLQVRDLLAFIIEGGLVIKENVLRLRRNVGSLNRLRLSQKPRKIILRVKNSVAACYLVGDISGYGVLRVIFSGLVLIF